MHIIIYSDGASKSNPGIAGAGAVLTDSEGKVLDTTRKYLGIKTNNYAEYQGAIIGLQKALEIGASQVSLRADSELMIKQLRGEYKVKHPDLKPLHKEVMELLHQFDKFHPPEHIPRQQNKLADAEANKAIDERRIAE
ncbi:MAG: hypothetical protein NVS2B14_12890 [Chamaesiphon sp.]